MSHNNYTPLDSDWQNIEIKISYPSLVMLLGSVQYDSSLKKYVKHVHFFDKIYEKNIYNGTYKVKGDIMRKVTVVFDHISTKQFNSIAKLNYVTY